MTTAELIAQLQASDPAGTKQIFAYHPEDDSDMVVTLCDGASADWVLLHVEAACVLCRNESSEGDDAWDGLCPGCADRVSEYMDEHEASRDDAVNALGEQEQL